MEALLLGIAGVAASAAAAGALAVRSLIRRNRVHPHRPTTAPVHWLVSWRAPARLHRRLRRSAVAARLALAVASTRRSSWPALTDLVHELERRACEIDDQLAVAGRAPSPLRRRLLADLHTEIVQAEAVTERVVKLARSWSATAIAAPDIDELNDRLDALEGALAEVQDLEVSTVI